MNSTLQNQLSASLFRQLYYLQLAHFEHTYFVKSAVSSGIKNTLSRMMASHRNGITTILSMLPLSSHIVRKDLEMSEEKIRAMSSIIERLAVMDEAQVLQLENDFVTAIQIQY